MFISSVDAQMIVDELKKAIRRDLNIMNGKGIIVASTDRSRIGVMHDDARLLLSSENKEFIISSDCEEKGTKRGINLPIIIQDKRIGVIGITGDPDDVSELGSAIRKMTEIMIIGIQRQMELSLWEIERLNFIDSWISSAAVGGYDFETRASLLGIDLSIPRIICVFECSVFSKTEEASFKETSTAMLIKRIKPLVSENAQNIVTSVNNRIVILFAEQSVDAVYRHATRICGEIKSVYGLESFCGISQMAADYHLINERYNQALDACGASIRFGAKKILIYESGALFYLIQSLPREHLESLERKVFKDCSEKEKSEMIETLNLYFFYNGDIAHAASAIFVHPNTFLYRLNKFHSKTGLNPRKPQDIGTLAFLWGYYQVKGVTIHA